MLRMNPHRSPNGAKRYFTHELTRHEYFAERSHTFGTWHGKGAKLLGLPDEVTARDFASLCDNEHPLTGNRLTVRNKVNRTVAYDLNFHPPKSVSVLHALNQDDRILEAFRKAVRETMQEIEARAETRVRVAGQDENRPTGNLVWAEFIHLTSRPVEGMSDPHLHAHCFVFNCTKDGVEQRWKAGQFREINRDAPYFQAAFHSRLALNLRAIGYEIVEKGLSFEIASVPEEVIGKFSQRTRQIDEFARRRNITDKKRKASLGAITREAKRTDLSSDELRRSWLERLNPIQRESLTQVPETPKATPSTLSMNPADARRCVEYAKRHSFERLSVVDEMRFLAAALRHGMGRVHPKAIHDALAEDRSLIRQQKEGRTQITTPDIIAEELNLVGWVKSGRGRVDPLVGAVRRPARLGNDQWDAMRHVLASRDTVTGILGKSGTGKTTMMQETIAEARKAGHAVGVFAPTAETARGTLREGGFPNAETLERLFSSREIQESVRRGVIWVDEAGLLSLRDMARVTDLAEKLEARVVLSGDTGQHRSVKRGDAFRILAEHAGLDLARLTQIRRQSGIYRDAVDDLSENRLMAAFEKLDSMGAILEIPTHERHDTLAREYLDAIQRKESVLVVSPTHAEGKRVTSLIRNGLKASGKIRDERQFPALHRIDLHEADQADPRSYREGWVLEMVRPAVGLPSGKRLMVISTGPNGITAQDTSGNVHGLDVGSLFSRFQVYEREILSLGAGDRIRITKNGTDSRLGQSIHNGSLHTVAGFTSAGDIRLKDGKVVSQHYCHLAHGYVTTSYAAQSKTVDRVIVAEGSESFNAASREQFYVSVSRGRQHVTVYTDSKAELFEAVQKTSQRVAAIDRELGYPTSPGDLAADRSLWTQMTPTFSGLPGQLHGDLDAEYVQKYPELGASM